MSERAVPCPFCGEEEIRLDACVARPRCPKCFASGPFISRFLKPGMTGKQAAMAAWNTRAGKLLALPCMVGDTVYYLNGTSERDFPWQITEVSVYGREPEKIIFRVGHEGTEDYAEFAADELGEQWFLDRAEAEEAAKAHFYKLLENAKEEGDAENGWFSDVMRGLSGRRGKGVEEYMSVDGS